MILDSGIYFLFIFLNIQSVNIFKNVDEYCVFFTFLTRRMSMSDEEYSFLSVKRSSRKIHCEQILKHSTPLTTCEYMSGLPTVNELDEHSYLSNCNTRENYEHPQQLAGKTVESQKNHEKLVHGAWEFSPHHGTNNYIESEIENEKTLRSEVLHTVTPDQEVVIRRSKPSTKTRRSSQIKALKKLRIVSVGNSVCACFLFYGTFVPLNLLRA